jgi:CheY-like chemotaxis protein
MTMDSGKKVILFVDDEIELRELVSQALRPLYHVIGVSDGGTAWEALRGGVRPDLIILDLHLPGISGYRLIANIRENPELAKLPILLVSGDVQLDDIAAALKITGYLDKPASGTELRAKIGTVLGQ